MKAVLVTIVVFLAGVSYGQQKQYWTKSNRAPSNQSLPAKFSTTPNQVYILDFVQFKNDLKGVNKRGEIEKSAAFIMTFPSLSGKMESFKIIEASIMHPTLSAKYPEINSFAGQGIDDPTAIIRFSMSNELGFHAMVMSSQNKTVFIDPLSKKDFSYIVYSKKDLSKKDLGFECFTEESIQTLGNESILKTDDKKLRKYRLALSCTAEYGNIFAGTGTDAEKKANILAQMNLTMTRVNGVYERDLAITMELVANNEEIIYFGNTSEDPWASEWNSQTQITIDNIIGDANYDIGHNFNTTGGGNAGCIGCVCASGQKGSAYTGRANPTGDPFDIDYVAHEIGHQFGGYHTQSNSSCRSGSGTTEVEPGSASTIMGYAGICSANVQNNSDAYFHYVNIRDISANVQNGVSAGCAQIINLVNNAPTANAGADYTIPTSTAFVLKGIGSDPDGDAITYTWEQNDPENPSSNSPPHSTRVLGPMFRSVEGTTMPNRYMPQVSDVLAGNLTPTWEVVPSVARTMEFALTVRDNNAEGGQTDDDLMVVTVDGGSGPFELIAPNTAITWYEGQNQMVLWSVANTDLAPVNSTHVNILLSIDGGNTFPISLFNNVPNNGEMKITVPNTIATNCRVKIESTNNIFYAVSTVDFEIAEAVACVILTPTGLAATQVNGTSATLTWDANAGATFNVQYKPTHETTWVAGGVGGNTKQINGLLPETEYEYQVKSVCDGSSSSYSASYLFTTTVNVLEYCVSEGADISDEYIGRVQLGSIDNTTGATTGYSDYTTISTSMVQNSVQEIIITPVWTGAVFSEGYGVWIDYNQNGSFEDANEQVWTTAPTTTSPVTGSFTIPASAIIGTTRMRVSLKYNGIPSSCELFSYGEVEDYSVEIVSEVNPPILTHVSIESNNANTTLAKEGDLVTINFIANKTLQSSVVTIFGEEISATANGTNWSVSAISTASTSEGIVPFIINYKDLTNQSGTQVSATTNSSMVTVDITDPILNHVRVFSNNVDSEVATIDDIITLLITPNEEIMNLVVTLAGENIDPVLDEGSWQVNKIMQMGDAEGAIPFSIDYTDFAGNEGITVLATTDFSSVEFREFILGIGENSLMPAIKVYPNPASNHLIIELDDINRIDNIKITDVGGKTIMDVIHKGAKNAKLTVNLSELTNGVYIIQLSTKDGVYKRLLIINK